jgi:polyhydroxybutyrate depolymerase
MRGAAILILLACSGCASFRSPEALTPPTTAPGTTEHSVRIGVSEELRTYLLHVPPNQPRQSGAAPRLPLIILLHGSGADGNEIREESRMDSLADANRFIAAYPNASTTILGKHHSDWNAGNCCGSAASEDVDDIGFLRGIIHDLSERLPVDTTRIYIAGFSDGGRMTYRAACEMANQIAAIGVVSGSLQDPECHPAVPVSLVALHGTADTQVPYTDSLDSMTWPLTIPAAKDTPPSLRFWASEAGCQGYTVLRVSPVVVRGVFSGCRARTEVVLYTVEGAGHGWFTAANLQFPHSQSMPPVAAAEILVPFLLRHSR